MNYHGIRYSCDLKVQRMLDYFSHPSTEFFDVPVVQRFIPEDKTFIWYSTRTNISTLQRHIIKSVLNMSRGKFRIGRQDETQLRVLMYNIFNEYKVFDSMDQFNDIVVSLATKMILTNINDSLYYNKNVDSVSMKSTNWQTGIMSHPERVDEDMSLKFSMRM